jgi:hypothetical protein
MTSVNIDNRYVIIYLAEVLRAVTHLQVNHAIKLCEDFLIEETTVENCIDVLSLADLFSIPVLEKVCLNFFFFSNFKIINFRN